MSGGTRPRTFMSDIKDSIVSVIHDDECRGLFLFWEAWGCFGAYAGGYGMLWWVLVGHAYVGMWCEGIVVA